MRMPSGITGPARSFAAGGIRFVRLSFTTLFPLSIRHSLGFAFILCFLLPIMSEGTEKSLDRFSDPVLVEGSWLPEFVGKELASLRLYSYEYGSFQPIRFQVDERTPEGEWVFPYGKKSNRPQGNGVLDGQDVLLFMAKDSGGKAPESTTIYGASCVAAIGLEDPAHQGQGFVYLASHPVDPPPLCSLPDYVTYKYETEEVYTDYAYSRFMISEDGLHSSFSEHGSVLPPGGGMGKNYLDRLKARVQIRFFFNLIPLSLNEEMFSQDVVAWIEGPVRVIRHLEQFVKLPFGIRGLKSFTEVHHYETIGIVPIEIHVPRGVNRIVSSSTVSFGADLAPNVMGALFHNSENPEPMVIDGRMSPSEKRFCTRRDSWRIIHGSMGSMMMKGLFPPELDAFVEVRQAFQDDLSVETPPEKYPGSIGYAHTLIRTKESRPGRYRIYMDVYFPPHFKQGDEETYLAVRDHPIRVQIRGREHVNRLNLD